MGDINDIAKQFTEFYYTTFDQNRGNLASLYRNNSMLTFESQQFQGAASIIEKLSNLPFQKVKHQIHTLDAQPCDPNGVSATILVNITGQLLVDDEQNPIKFSQSFQLVPADGSYYVFNDIFRLVYG